MRQGTVKWFDCKKGFGFVIDQIDGTEVMVHYTAIEGDGFRRLKDGMQVQFKAEQGEKGLHATVVRVVSTGG